MPIQHQQLRYWKINHDITKDANYISENYFDFVTLESIATEMQFATLTTQLDSTLNQFQVRIMDILKRIGPQMQEALRKAMFHVAWSPDTLPTNQAVEPLFDYLHTHLQVLNVALLPQNFQKVLYEVSTHYTQLKNKQIPFTDVQFFKVWEYTLDELSHQMDGGTTNDEIPPMFHERLHSALELLVDFFHSEGQALSTDVLHSDAFCQIEQRLQYHRTDTESLIEIFYGQRLHEQMNISSSPYGNLAVRAYFNHDSLCVEVNKQTRFISGSNIFFFAQGATRTRHHPTRPERFQRSVRDNRTPASPGVPALQRAADQRPQENAAPHIRRVFRIQRLPGAVSFVRGNDSFHSHGP